MLGLFSSAYAEDSPAHKCITKENFGKNSPGVFAEVTPEQFQFLRGIYLLNPQEENLGLPVGDKIVMYIAKEDGSGLVFFVDGNNYCDPMVMPKILVDTVLQVGDGTIIHLNDNQSGDHL